ncbi:hypothetical protein Hanom_Chr17g01578331 [Helianthus anomalus]
MALGAGSKMEIRFIDQGVKWLFSKVWGKTVKVTKPQGAKRKFTLNYFKWDRLFTHSVAMRCGLWRSHLKDASSHTR